MSFNPSKDPASADGLFWHQVCDLQPIYKSIALKINPVFFSVVLLMLLVLLWHSRRAEHRTRQFQGNENGR